MRKQRGKGLSLRAVGFKAYLFKLMSLTSFAVVFSGSYIALDCLGMIPDYKTPKDRAREAMEDERKRVTEAKRTVPELYPEPVEFYLKDVVEAYEKASDK